MKAIQVNQKDDNRTNVKFSFQRFVFSMFAIMIAMAGFYGCDDTPEVSKKPGDGSAGDPFKVANVADLKRVGTGEAGLGGIWAKDKHYKQVADINLQNIEWTPLGSSYFRGTYDGGGYTISNLKITGNNGDVGLFGKVTETGVIRNVRLTDVNISGKSNVGAVVGILMNGGTIDYCSVNRVNIVTTYLSAGGIVGDVYNSNCMVNHCIVTNGTISSNSHHIGGVVGSNSGTVKNCYATVDVSCETLAGGIVGGNSGLIQFCYTTGNVTSVRQQVGGIAGANTVATGVIRNCVALNKEVKRTATTGGAINNMGRIAGDNVTGAKLEKNYARSDMKLTTGGVVVSGSSTLDTSVHGANTGSAELNGANSAAWWAATSKASFPATEWDFANNRLPYLKGFDGLIQNPEIKY